MWSITYAFSLDKEKPKDRQNRPNQTLRNFKIQIRS